MSKWTPDEDARLKELAADGLTAADIARALEGRSESAVSGRCSKLSIRLRSAGAQALREYLAEGGRVVREDVGGAIGICWARASRSGGIFATATCERFAALGFIRPEPGHPNVFGPA